MSTNSEAPEVAVSGWWQSMNFGSRAIDAFKAGLAAVLCVWLGNLFGLSHSYWAAVSAIVVMGSDNTVTFASCRDRIIGTAIGAFLGWAAVDLDQDDDGESHGSETSGFLIRQHAANEDAERH